MENEVLVVNEEVLKKYEELQKELGRVKKELDTLSSSIKKELQTKFNTTTKISGYNFIVKGGYWTCEFDMERFKEENPELFIKYQKAKQVPISYSFVKATREKKNGED